VAWAEVIKQVAPARGLGLGNERHAMNFYMDESGNTGDIARTGEKLDFGGQPVFSLVAIGVQDEQDLDKELGDLRKKHKVLATELKLTEQLKKKPNFVLEAVDLLVANDFPYFAEVVDKRYQLAVSITNGFIWPPYFNTEESEGTVWLKNIFADYLYYKLPDAAFYEFVLCMRQSSNEWTARYFDILKASVINDPHEVAQGIAEQTEESKDDFRLMVEREGAEAWRRFLPLPDISKRGKEIWVLPNFSSFTNIYARINLYLSGNLAGTKLLHDEQAHFDEIIAAAKSLAENADMSSASFKPRFSDYNFEQVADLCFKTSPESAGIQLADVVVGLCMRWYQAHMRQETDTQVLDRAIDKLLRHSDRDQGVGINVVGPHQMAQQLFGVRGY